MTTILSYTESNFGYSITMSDPAKNIMCSINNEQKCCERFGVYTSQKLDSFVGAEYISVEVSQLSSSGKKFDDFMTTIEVLVHTNKGDIKFTLYNEHNGYYKHTAFIKTELGEEHKKI